MEVVSNPWLNLWAFVWYIINFLILIGWPLLALLALFRLRQRNISDVARALWAILVVIVPLLGAIAFFVIQPGEDRQHRNIR
jgi:hypothetical protein